ncbi:MAG: hypothetical protein ACP5E4_01445 [Candidatus Aenigmatarchaeota archaeon]
MRLKIPCGDFDFQKTFGAGLFYFFYGAEPVRRVVFEGQSLDLSFRQKGDEVWIDSAQKPKNPRALKERIRYCLGLHEDISEFHRLCRKDPVLKGHFGKIQGTRIISAFSDFEALVGAIVSQNNSYKNYRKKMLEIYSTIGFEPAAFTEKNLEGMGLGYKVPFLLNLAKDFGKKELLEIGGIGPYSVRLFEIFQRRNYNAFYIDCLTEKIMRDQYGVTKNLDAESIRIWGEWRGLAEAYLQRFFEAK